MTNIFKKATKQLIVTVYDDKKRIFTKDNI